MCVQAFLSSQVASALNTGPVQLHLLVQGNDLALPTGSKLEERWNQAAHWLWRAAQWTLGTSHANVAVALWP